MDTEEIRKIREEVVHVVDRSGCSKCGLPEWGNPERLTNISDIPGYLRWYHHKDRQLCDASATLEEQYQKVFGDSEKSL
jgi:hypothetical protein